MFASEYLNFEEKDRKNACAAILLDIGCMPWVDDGTEFDKLLIKIFQEENESAIQLLSFLLDVNKEDLPGILTTFYCREAENPEDENLWESNY